MKTKNILFSIVSVIVVMMVVRAVYNARMETGHTITLAWENSPSPGVIEYRVYQQAANGRFKEVATVRHSRHSINTTCTVVRPAEGATYWVAAVDSAGNESPLSQSISLPPSPIPPPLKLKVTPLEPNLTGVPSSANVEAWSPPNPQSPSPK